MSLEADLVTTLGPVFDGRFYLMVAPAKVEDPYAVYQLVSGIWEMTIDGATPNLKNGRYQVSIFGRDAATLISLVADSNDAMLASPLFSVGEMLEMDEFEDPALLYGKLLDFSIWHSN